MLTTSCQNPEITLNLFGGSRRATRDWQLLSTRCQARNVLLDAGSYPPLAGRLTACYPSLAVTFKPLPSSQSATRRSYLPLITTPATCCHGYNIHRLAVPLKMLSGFQYAARGWQLLLTCRYTYSMVPEPLDYPQVTAINAVVPKDMS